MLDWPLMEFLDAAWVDHDMPGAQGNARVQAARPHRDGYSRRLYGQGGIMPAFVSHQVGVGAQPAPLIHYRGADVLETLARACARKKAIRTRASRSTSSIR